MATIDRQVRLAPYEPGAGLPLFIHPESAELSCDIEAAAAWVNDNRPELDDLLVEYGAYVLRGFAVHDTDGFTRIIACYPYASLDYTAGATPRAAISGRVYEATKTPADYWIGPHQEMSYLPSYPARLAFYCHVPPETGGETVLVDIRRFESQMPEEFRDQVRARGIRYVRNFRSPDVSSGHERLDLAHKDWCDAFGTDVPAEATRKAQAMGLEARWLDDGGLEVSHVSSGFANHPVTGQSIWFNQLTTQYICRENLGARADLWFEYYVQRGRPLPYTATWGDGEEIAKEDRAILYQLLDKLLVSFPWQHGDVMVIDNMLTAHGRNPFSGERDVQVALLG